MSNCNSLNPISSCFGRLTKRDLRLNQKQYKLSSSEHQENKKALSVINNGFEYAENQNVFGTFLGCPTNVGGPGLKHSSMFRFNDKMLEKTEGLDKKHGSYTRYLLRKKGWNAVIRNCAIDETILCISPITKMYSDTNFIFVSTATNDINYSFRNGSYLIKNVPEKHALFIFNENKEDLISLSSTNTKVNNHSNYSYGFAADQVANGIPNGSTFYYGDVTITVKGDFDKMSIFSYEGGLMNGEDLFFYNSKHCN